MQRGPSTRALGAAVAGAVVLVTLRGTLAAVVAGHLGLLGLATSLHPVRTQCLRRQCLGGPVAGPVSLVLRPRPRHDGGVGREVRWMKFTMRDVLGTVLFLAAGLVYWAFLVDAQTLFTTDERGMTVVGLFLGAMAFLVTRLGDAFDTTGRLEWTVAGVSLALGVVALILSGSASAATWLAVFMTSLAVVWLMELVDHVGWLPHQGTPTASHA